MTNRAELLNELTTRLTSAGQTQQPKQCSSPSDAGVTVSPITLKQGAHFRSAQGSDVRVEPGDYDVSVLPDGNFLLRSKTEMRIHSIMVRRTGHVFNLESSLALSVPMEHAESIVLLFPGGHSLVAMGRRNVVSAAADLAPPSSEAILQSIHTLLHVFPPSTPAPHMNKDLLSKVPSSHILAGKISPGNPARFANQQRRLNWVSAVLLESGDVIFPPELKGWTERASRVTSPPSRT